MAEIQPLRALHYDPAAVGSLEGVIAPPYDVVDAGLRAELERRSPYNVVGIDLPEAADGADPYAHARDLLAEWRDAGVVVRDEQPALWALTQDYQGPDGTDRTRHGFFCRVRVEDYGAGRIRPHERTHPGPLEDRLRLTRATQANLSPIFSLFPDPDGRARAAMKPATAAAEPWAEARDLDGTLNRLWRVGDPTAVSEVVAALADRELLIADGHHRYETARAYAEEVGGEGDHRYVLMFLCSLSDPGLTIFPTHRLLSALDPARREALAEVVERDFRAEAIEPEDLEPDPGAATATFGYLDAHDPRPLRLTLKYQSIADAALAGRSEPYRRLDTAVLEALVLRGGLGMSEDDIAHLRGLAYSKDFADARGAVEDGRAEAAFFLAPTQVEQVSEVAAAGETMPPKSTYFYPKIPTGLLFNPLA